MLLIKDLKKSFIQPDGTRLPILDIPEFRVAAGEQMALMGRSGCGKTTLLHVIAGISRPDSGLVASGGLQYPAPLGAWSRPLSGRQYRLRLSNVQSAAGLFGAGKRAAWA